MQTKLAASIQATEIGKEADRILRACVHCGYCNATCPTYQLLGDELDGPRGRIYLIKQLLEGQPVSRHTQLHLDRCIGCQACETTCPSGVAYGHLADLGRDLIEHSVARPVWQRCIRWCLRKTITERRWAALLLRVARVTRFMFPVLFRKQSLGHRATLQPPTQQHPRRMLLLEGCIQPALSPDTNIAAASVLNRLGITLQGVTKAGCCGALSYHLNAQQEGMNFMRRNIDAWWPEIDSGIEAIVMTASGCGAFVKNYGYTLRHDPDYADKAARISALVRDLSEVLQDEDLTQLKPAATDMKIVFQSPCSLQHGQKLDGAVECLLGAIGFELLPLSDGHLCCGAGGAYSLLQRDLAERLRTAKLGKLLATRPDVIATANIGCQQHLQGIAPVPVRHWVELVAQQCL